MSTILPPPVTPYPLATKSQEVVPHELAAPAGCYKLAVAAGAFAVLANVPATPVVAVSCAMPTLLIFSDDPNPPSIVEGELIGGAMFCPPGTTTIGRPTKQRLWVLNESDEAITVYIQLLHTWNILGTSSQVTRI